MLFYENKALRLLRDNLCSFQKLAFYFGTMNICIRFILISFLWNMICKGQEDAKSHEMYKCDNGDRLGPIDLKSYCTESFRYPSIDISVLRRKGFASDLIKELPPSTLIFLPETSIHEENETLFLTLLRRGHIFILTVTDVNNEDRIRNSLKAFEAVTGTFVPFYITKEITPINYLFRLTGLESVSYILRNEEDIVRLKNVTTQGSPIERCKYRWEEILYKAMDETQMTCLRSLLLCNDVSPGEPWYPLCAGMMLNQVPNIRNYRLPKSRGKNKSALYHWETPHISEKIATGICRVVGVAMITYSLVGMWMSKFLSLWTSSFVGLHTRKDCIRRHVAELGKVL